MWLPSNDKVIRKGDRVGGWESSSNGQSHFRVSIFEFGWNRPTSGCVCRDLSAWVTYYDNKATIDSSMVQLTSRISPLRICFIVCTIDYKLYTSIVYTGQPEAGRRAGRRGKGTRGNRFQWKTLCPLGRSCKNRLSPGYQDSSCDGAMLGLLCPNFPRSVETGWCRSHVFRVTSWWLGELEASRGNNQQVTPTKYSY
jgi:hypothetical protein